MTDRSFQDKMNNRGTFAIGSPIVPRRIGARNENAVRVRLSFSSIALIIASIALLPACLGVHGMAKHGDSADTGEPSKDWSVKSKGLVATEGAFFTGKHRNVFAEMGKSQDQIDQKVKLAYETYFSTTDENRLYYTFSKDKAYLLDIAHDDIRSEGQSYGMMIALQMDDQEKFNKIWKFSFEHLRIADPAHPNHRGYAWAVSKEGKMCDENSAPDGEEYFALALYFAHHRWGSASSEKAYNNYKHWADDVVDMMKNRPSISGPRKRQNVTSDGSACVGAEIVDRVTSVPLFDAEQKQIRFNATKGENWTDPSYHLPAFYDLFAIWGPKKDSAFWHDAAATSRSYLARTMHEKTGLVTEYTNYDGSPHGVSFNSNSALFAYDSWRVGGNVGLDWAWMMQPDAEPLRARADTLISFFYDQGPTTYLALYPKDGSKPSGHHSPGLVAMNAVATLAATEAVAEKSAAMLEEFWNTALPTGKYRYYDGMLYSFAILHLSGRYRIYHPEGEQFAAKENSTAEERGNNTADPGKASEADKPKPSEADKPKPGEADKPKPGGG